MTPTPTKDVSARLLCYNLLCPGDPSVATYNDYKQTYCTSGGIPTLTVPPPTGFVTQTFPFIPATTGAIPALTTSAVPASTATPGNSKGAGERAAAVGNGVLLGAVAIAGLAAAL
eukprot:jgi/Hompol1/1168/HPOL_005521-RA